MTKQRPNGLAVGLTSFAAIMMFILGTFHAFAGLIAVVDGDYYVAGTRYLFKFDTTAWGVIHIILGCIVVVAAYYLLQGAIWARAVAVVLAVVSALAAFAWIPQSPIMAVVLIALDVLIVWALTMHGSDITRTHH